jgi:hypothetical protein
MGDDHPLLLEATLRYVRVVPERIYGLTRAQWAMAAARHPGHRATLTDAYELKAEWERNGSRPLVLLGKSLMDHGYAEKLWDELALLRPTKAEP